MSGGASAGHRSSCAMPAPLYLLAINLTRRCNLACAHCYLDAGTRRGGRDDELASGEVCAILDRLASRGDGSMVVLTGGEPLLRGDLETMVAHGAGLGLAMVVGSNGMALTAAHVRSLMAAGALGVGISVDSLDAASHDGFRGLPGAWERTMAGIEACRREGLSFQIHFSVTEANAAELAAMIDFARAVGARALNVFFLVCTGRGESMSDISPLHYERTLDALVDAQGHYPDLIIRARCAPHFKRIAHQRRPDSLLNRIAGSDGDGCIAGRHYCRITPEGAVTACPYIEASQGNVRERPFLEIWDGAEDFRRLRAPVLGGRCGACEYRALCGGCRARPLAAGGDLMDEDPVCAHVPSGTPVIVPIADLAQHGVRWSDAARERLERVPPFLRRLVERRAEAYVAELGERVVVPEHLSALAAKRFGANPPRPPRVEGAGR
jgi:radical SAM protein with 4Fe4S-binding SPASM domain